jgi:hypothetical protein
MMEAANRRTEIKPHRSNERKGEKNYAISKRLQDRGDGPAPNPGRDFHDEQAD